MPRARASAMNRSYIRSAATGSIAPSKLGWLPRPHVAEDRELADHQQLATNVGERVPHLPFVVRATRRPTTLLTT